MFSPEGNLAKVPGENYANALQQGFTPATVMTSPEGKDAYVPHEKLSDALKAGFKVGPASQQAIGEAPAKGYSSNAPGSSFALGVASGLGIPESEQPVSDLAASILEPQNAVASSSAPKPIPELQPGDQEAYDKALAKRSLLQRMFGSNGDLDPAIAKRVQAHDAAMLEDAYRNYAPGIPVVSPAIAAAGNEADKSVDAFRGGRPYEGIVRAAGAAVPLVGPAAVEAGNEIGQGAEDKNVDEMAHGAGNATGIIGGLLLGTKKGQALADAALEKTVRPAARVLQGAAPRALSGALGGGAKAMAKRPIPQQTAAGVASNAEVDAYAKAHGIDLLPGQATGAKGLQTLQAIGERAVVAPGVLPDVLDQQKANFGGLVDDFRGRVAKGAINDTESAGTSLQSQARNALEKLKSSAQGDYAAFQQATGDIPVDLSEVKEKYGQQLADQAEALKNVPSKYSAPIRNVLNKLSSIEAGGEIDPKLREAFDQAVKDYNLGPEAQASLRESLGIPDSNTAQVRMSTAQQLRSAYLDIARDYSGNVPKSVQRIASQAAKDIDAAMGKAADSVGATDQWRQANAKWKQLQETFNNPDHPLYKILQASDPSQVPGKVLGKGTSGGSPQTIRQLKQAGIDLAPLKHEVVQQIADKNFALTNGGRGLAGYTTPFLQELFTPAELDELTKMGRVGRAIRFEMNPSGTSNVQQGERQIHGIIARSSAAVVGPAASRLTTSSGLARAARGGVLPGEASASRPFLGLTGLRGSVGGSGPSPSGGNAPSGPSGGGPATRGPSFLRSAPERRQNVDLRAAVDAMTPEEREAAIFTNDKTGLPNGRAFQMAQSQLETSHPHVGFADVDDFKSFNTKLGHTSVNSTVFPAIGDAIKQAIDAENGAVHAFHVHGDEFQFLGSDPDAIGRVVDRVNSQLKNAEFRVQNPDGSVITVKGAGLSYGTGKTLAEANAAEKLSKQTRKEAGLRVGERDQAQNTAPGSAQVAPSGQQNTVGDNAQRQGVQPPVTEASDRPRSIADILGNRSQEKIDLNAPKSKRREL